MSETRTGSSNRLLIAGGTALLAVLLTGVVGWACFGQGRVTVLVGGEALQCEVADTAGSRERGLVGHEELALGEGMLFVNDSPEPVTIRMKEVDFPIDVTFVDERLQVIKIAALYPDSPRSIASSTPAMYVIETPQGWLDAKGVRVGSTIGFLGGRP